MRVNKIGAGIGVAENRGDVQDARALLVLGDELRRARRELSGIEGGDLRQMVGGDVIIPDAGDIRLEIGRASCRERVSVLV